MPGRVREVAAQIAALEKQGAKKLVLDLRHCSTGPDEEGIALANLFQDSGLITYTLGQKSARQDFKAQVVEGRDQAAAGGDRESLDGGRRGDCGGGAAEFEAREGGGRAHLRRRGGAARGDAQRRQRGDSFGGQVLFAGREIDSG